MPADVTSTTAAPTAAPKSLPGQHARPGRPRTAGTDRAILDAVRALLSEHGYHAMSIEAVAARAGVAKTTLYRRWSTKADLVVDAVADIFAPLYDAPADSDPEALLAELVRAMSRPESRAAFLALLAESATDPLVRERADARLVAPARALVDRCAVRSGSPVDRDLLFDVVTGAVMHRVLVLGKNADKAFVRGLLELVNA